MVDFSQPVSLSFIFETIGVIITLSLIGVGLVKLGKKR